VLLFEIAATRILSVVLWYHWAFLAVSLAMLGLGAPGAWFSLRPPRPESLSRWLVLAALLLPLSVVAILRWNPALASPSWRVAYTMLCLLPPFLALGAAVCQILLEAREERVGAVYAADLLGACAAAVLVIPLMHRVATPKLVVAVAAAPLIAAWLAAPRPLRPGLAAAGALAAAGIAALLGFDAPLRVGYSKSYDETQLGLLLERWTPMARLAVFDGVFWVEDRGTGFGWGLGSRVPRGAHPKEYWIEQDGSAGTPITNFDGDLARVSHLLYDVVTLGFQVGEPERVAVIGAGGGRDVLAALVSGAKQVDAVEINPHLVEILSTRFRDFAGDIYGRDGVRAVVGEGRSFLLRSPDRFDLIQISLIDSWAATAAGAFSLSENNLYTLEAYRLYWRRLTDAGMVSTSRWIKGKMGVELPRLLALALAALHAEGIDRPERHLAIAQGGSTGTLLVSRRPFEGELAERLRAVCEDRGFSLLHPAPAGGRAPGLLGDLLLDPEGAIQRAPVDLSPPTDDRPFFFHVLPVFRRVDPAFAARYGINGEAVLALQMLMQAVATLALALFFVPFARSRRLGRGPGFWPGTLYFAAIGLGFMLIEVPWLQRFVLFLGHPSHAMTVVLAALLLGAGLGSLWSPRISPWRLPWLGLAAIAALAAVNAGLPALFERALGWPFGARVAVSLAVLVPVAIPLGGFFPLGIARFGAGHTAWFWAVNGAAGVLAGVVSLALAMDLGLSRVTWIGIACYAAATAVSTRSGTPRA
jgi:hypothetical protein